MDRADALKRGLVLVVLFVTSFQLAACKPKPDPQANMPKPVEVAPDVEHRVSFSGETLGIIAAWYTGKATNWLAIKNANPGLKPERINLGQTIIIPADIVIERTPLTKKFVQDAIAKLSKLKAAQPVPSKDEVPTGLTGTDGGVTGGVGYGSGDTATGYGTGSPDITGSGNAVSGTTAGSVGSEVAPPIDVAPPVPTAAPATPPADSERDKLLDELLSQ